MIRPEKELRIYAKVMGWDRMTMSELALIGRAWLEYMVMRLGDLT